MTLKEKIAQVTTGKNPAKQVTSFGDAVVRSTDASNLRVGDEFTFPENWTEVLFEQQIGENKAYYVLVEVADGVFRNFYPSSLVKAVDEFTADGMPTGNRVIAQGTASEDAQQNYTGKSLNDLANHLGGRRLRVEAASYPINNNGRRTGVFTINYVK